jgi:hypothetical protein
LSPDDQYQLGEADPFDLGDTMSREGDVPADEKEPVDDSEFVYRRIHPNFHDATLPIAVGLEAFRPSQSDVTGLSVLRARFAQPQDLFANRDPAKVSRYYVARLPVRDLHRLGLTVVPEPIPGGPAGHAVIPELSWPAYQAQKQHWKAVLVELAKLASMDIVHRPS